MKMKLFIINGLQYWIAVIILVLIQIFLAIIQVNSDYKKKIGDIKQESSRDLMFMQTYIKEKLQKGDYIGADYIIKELGGKHHYQRIIELKLTSKNGFVISNFQSNLKSENVYPLAADIAYSYHGKATLYLLTDLSSADLSRKKLIKTHILIILLSTSFLSFIIVITIRKNILTIDLRHSKTRYQTLIEQAADCMFVYDFDGNIIEVNNRASESLGYSREELLSMKVTDLDTVNFNLEKQRVIWNKLESSKSVTFEAIYRRKNGTHYPVEFRVGFIEIENKKAIIGLSRDITERKKAEDTLRETNDYLENLYNYANAPIIVWNIRFIITRFNHAFVRMSGYQADEVIGKRLDVLFPEESKKESLSQIQKTLSGKYWESVEIPILRKDREVRIAIWNSANIFAKDSKTIISTIAQGYDITERKQAEKELKKYQDHLEELVKERTKELELKNAKIIESQEALALLLEDMNKSSKQLNITNEQLEMANKEMETFSYSVSHDLRAPLTRMNGFSGALLDLYKDKLDEKGVHYLNRIKVSSQKMEQLINDMLSLSRISRQQITKKNVNISKISQKIINTYKNDDPDRKIDITIEEKIEIYCDIQLITIIFENILSNAWKFTSKNKKTKIEIGTKTIDNKKIIYIKDNGVGFDMKYSDKVYLPFQRLHDESEFEGTGIGMATVYRIIKRHNAKIWVESEVGNLPAGLPADRQGKAGGTTFYLSF